MKEARNGAVCCTQNSIIHSTIPVHIPVQQYEIPISALHWCSGINYKACYEWNVSCLVFFPPHTLKWVKPETGAHQTCQKFNNDHSRSIREAQVALYESKRKLSLWPCWSIGYNHTAIVINWNVFFWERPSGSYCTYLSATG